MPLLGAGERMLDSKGIQSPRLFRVQQSAINKKDNKSVVMTEQLGLFSRRGRSSSGYRAAVLSEDGTLLAVRGRELGLSGIG